MKRETDCKKILDRMKEGKTVTTFWGFENGILRTASRIFDLKQQGHKVQSRWLQVPSGNQVKEYYL